MAYTDYEFYTTKFFGDTVPEEDFPKYAERASDRIDQYTFDRLTDGLPDNDRAKTKVQKAVCAIADTLYQIDQIKKASMDTVGTIQKEDGTVVNKTVSSVSSGNESISYATGNNAMSNSVYAQAAMDKKVENVLLLNIATEYLTGATNNDGVCLLYAGTRGTTW